MIRLAACVSLFKLQPQALFALHVVNAVVEERVDRTAVTLVSSVNDREHGEHSYHYEGLAFDVDWDPILAISDDFRRELACEISARLGGEFDVLAEDLGCQNSHLHVEYDRRRVEAKRRGEEKRSEGSRI